MNLYLTDKGRHRIDEITQGEFIGIDEKFELYFLRKAEAEEDIDIRNLAYVDYPLGTTKKAYTQILLDMKDKGYIESVVHLD